jgi:2-iminobutanoate/2-iminopropanoate deaminase
MVNTPIRSDNAPRPVGPYSQAIRSGGFVFCSGQIGINPDTGELAEGGIEGETMQVMENIKAVLAAAGTSLDNAVRMEVFLADMADYQKFNEVYSRYFTSSKPSRHALGVAKLPKDARVEISCTASTG